VREDPAGWRPKADYVKTVLCPVALDAGNLIKLLVLAELENRPLPSFSMSFRGDGGWLGCRLFIPFSAA
jgi:hypothetical protein